MTNFIRYNEASHKTLYTFSHLNRPFIHKFIVYKKYYKLYRIKIYQLFQLKCGKGNVDK